MKIIKEENLNLDEIVEELRQGAVIVYPTETCYGLGCDASNQAAVDKIFAIKKRQKDKALLVIADDPSTMINYVEWNEQLEQISEKYWPGPLTVVVETRPNCGLATGVEAEDKTVAFRITDHPLASTLSKVLGKPIVSTSANIAAAESPYDIESVRKMFEGMDQQPDVVIDSGILPHKIPSTIIKLNNGNFEVIRQGEVVV